MIPQKPNESEAIENLQRYLRQLSYREAISPPPIDGILENDTRRALREFQELYGLPVTGIATLDTWDALYAAYRASVTEGTPPHAVLILPASSNAFPLKAESNGLPVTVLQHMLAELSALYSETEAVRVTGIYDAATSRAVQALREKLRLPPGDTVDIPVWNAITDQYNILFSTEE